MVGATGMELGYFALQASVIHYSTPRPVWMKVRGKIRGRAEMDKI